MYVLSNQLLIIAWGARDRAFAAKTDQMNWSSDATIAIILSAAATEGFINELAELVNGRKKCADAFRISPQVSAFGDALEEAERSRASIRLKYLIASQTLSGQMFDKGKHPYQDFERLIKLRDDHMHLKPLDTEPVSEGGVLVTKPPPYIEAFTAQGLAQKVDKGVSLAWLHRVQTAEMADWACRTALNIILAVLDMFPDGNHMKDMSYGFKRVFRQDNGCPKPWDNGTRRT
jgi:hypothetical protein